MYFKASGNMSMLFFIYDAVLKILVCSIKLSKAVHLHMPAQNRYDIRKIILNFQKAWATYNGHKLQIVQKCSI